MGKTSDIKCADGKVFSVRFDELTEESVLGHGEFGVVKKMYHGPSRMRFAVKVTILSHVITFYFRLN